jgi:hypothetical protein
MSKIIEWYKSETFENTEKIKNMLNLLKCPMDILNKQEIQEINILISSVTDSFSKLCSTFEPAKGTQSGISDKEINSCKKEYEEVKEDYTSLKKKVAFYNDKYNNKIKHNIDSLLLGEDTQLESESAMSEKLSVDGNSDQGFPAITQVFLNTVITTHDIEELKKKKNLTEERKYLSKIFLLKLNEGKDQILVDFYMTVFQFSLKQKFSLEKTSTLFSIMFFIFNYSILSKKIIKQKSLSLFTTLIEYHTIHRPPYSYQVFDLKEKKSINEFVKNTFFRNYSLFENIFKYNVNIYLTTKEPKSIPKELFPSLSLLKQDFMVEDVNASEFYNFIYETYVSGSKTVEDLHIKPKTEIEEYSETQMNKLNTYMSSFYASNINQQDNADNELNKSDNKKINNEQDVTETKNILNNKIKDFQFEINEQINLGNRALENNINKKLPEQKDLKDTKDKKK